LLNREIEEEGALEVSLQNWLSESPDEDETAVLRSQLGYVVMEQELFEFLVKKLGEE